MKIAEKIEVDGDKFHLIERHDVSASLERSRLVRSNGLGRLGESEPIASVPLVVVSQWLTEAGLRWDSPREEIRKLIERKVRDPDFALFRLTDKRI